jgi:hypothetical protein
MDKNSTAPIALFIPGLNVGGAQRVMVNLANEFSRATPAPVHLVVCREQGPLLREVWPRVKVIGLGHKRTSRSLFALSRYLRTASPQALFSRLNYANVIAALAWRLAGRPGRLILTEANVLRLPSPGLYRRTLHATMTFMMRQTYSSAHTLVANSHDTLESLFEAGIRGRYSNKVIGNPVAIDQIIANLTNLQPEIALPKRFICSIGRLVPQEGIRYTPTRIFACR